MSQSVNLSRQSSLPNLFAAERSRTNSAASSVHGETIGETGRLGDHAVQQLAEPRAPSRLRNLGERVATFFRTTLPDAFHGAADRVLSFLRPSRPAPAQAAAVAPAPPPPFDPSVNAGLSGPITGARLADLLARLQANIDPSGLTNQMVDVALPGRDGAALCEVFVLDLDRRETAIPFNGVPMTEVLQAPRGNKSLEDAFPRSVAFFDAMTARGVAQADTTVLSRLLNQSLLGCLQEQTDKRPDLVPNLKLPGDGGEIPLTLTGSGETLAITQTPTGFTVTADARFPTTALPTMTGETLLMKSGSGVQASLTAVLERDAGGRLQLTRLENASFTASLVTENGAVVV